MSNGLYSAVHAMSANERALDTVSQNLANVSTIGYRRRGTEIRSFDVMLDGQRSRSIGTDTWIDQSQGVLKRTGETWNLALEGDGFFAVDGPQGELLTRDGSFQTTAEGELINGAGYPVVWDKREARIDPTGQAVTVDYSGTVRQGATELGRLRVVDYAPRAKLQPAGNGYFTAPRGVAEVPATAEVHQGALEEANSNAMLEMVDMIQLQRSFEMASNTLSQIDQSYRRLIRPQG